MQVPGGYQDSLSSNTELGRAVQDACEELDNLSNLVCLASAAVISKHSSLASVQLAPTTDTDTMLQGGVCGAAGEGVPDRGQQAFAKAWLQGQHLSKDRPA